MSSLSGSFEVTPDSALEYLSRLENISRDDGAEIQNLVDRSLAQINADLSEKPGLFSRMIKGIFGTKTIPLKIGGATIPLIANSSDVQSYVRALREVFKAALDVPRFHKGKIARVSGDEASTSAEVEEEEEEEPAEIEEEEEEAAEIEGEEEEETAEVEEEEEEEPDTAEDALVFAMRIEKVLAEKVGMKAECSAILEQHCLAHLQKCRNIEKLEKFCRSFEAQQMFEGDKKDQFMWAIQKRISELLPTSQASDGERLAALYRCVSEHLDSEEKKRFGTMANDILLRAAQGLTMASVETLKKEVIALASAGIPVDQAGQLFSPLIEALAKKWEHEITELFSQEAFAKASQVKPEEITNQGALKEAIYQIDQKVIAITHRDIDSLQLEGLPDSVLGYVKNRLLQAKFKTDTVFASLASDMCISFAGGKVTSKTEIQALLVLTRKQLDELKSLQSSPEAPLMPALQWQIDRLERHIQHLNEKLGEIEKRSIEEGEVEQERAVEGEVPGAVVKKGPGYVRAIASSTSSIARGVFSSIPFLLTWAAPTVLAAVSGFEAGGVEGAVLSASMSVLTSLTATVVGSISGSVVRGTLFFMPEVIKKPIGATVNFAARLALTGMAMHYNCFLAGAAETAWVGVPLASAPGFEQGMEAFINAEKELGHAITVGLLSGETGAAQKVATIAKDLVEVGRAGYIAGSSTMAYSREMVRGVADLGNRVYAIGSSGVSSGIEAAKGLADFVQKLPH